MKRRPSLRNTCVGLVSTQPVGHSSRTIVRHAPVSGFAAVNSRMFCRRFARVNSSSLPSGDHDTR